MKSNMSDPMQPAPFQIENVKYETHDTFTMTMNPKGRSKNFNFSAGQFNMLYMFGVGEVPISISGDPTKPQTLVHTTRAVGAVTRAMSKLRRGDTIGVRGPYGRNWPLDAAKGKDIVLVTGGIGLAPLRPCLYKILGERDKYGKVVLLYGARTPEDILYRKELEKWRSRLDLEVHITVDRASGSWRGNVGVVTLLIQKAPFDPQNCLTMVCGPEVMMRFTVRELFKRGVSPDKIYISMERNMKCAVGLCGHCQFGEKFVCKDGPVFRYDLVQEQLSKREL